MREPRLGDIIDDYCVRCKRIMNHAVVSVVNAEPAKVRCRTCHSDHDYRHEQAPPPKVDLRKQALFNEVLKKVNPEASTGPADPAGPAGPVEGNQPAEPVQGDLELEAAAGAAGQKLPAKTARSKPKSKARK